MFFTERFI